MPRFRYRALRQSGGEIEGELVAEDERAAAAHLQGIGSLPIEIAPAARIARLSAARRGAKTRVSGRELALFTRQLAALLGAGIALHRALQLIAGDRGHSRRSALAWSLAAAVERGESLSRACGEHPAFERSYAMVIAAGEARGDLALALERLAAVLERNRLISQSLVNALAYPASVLVVAVLSVSFLLAFVVPRFETLTASFRHEPPLALSLLLATSRLFQSYGVPVAVIAVLLVALFLLRRRDAGFRLRVDRRLLALPAVGALIAKVETERLMFLLGSMVDAGVALPAAVAAAREATANEALRTGLAQAGSGIERGDGVGAALAAAGILPDLALELVRVGEETGALAPMLLKASDILRREIETTASQWIGLVAPLAMVVLGLVIGAIALALFSTVLEVYDIAS